jgi:tagatose 1,6-diphosphate aldolase
VREFARPEYGVDLLKLESPLPANDLPTRDGSVAARAAQKEFDAIGEICRSHGIPWVLLSGGAAHDKFERVLEYAYAAGAGGFLAGRTIWLDAVRTNFPDLAAVSQALKQHSVTILNSLSGLTGTRAPLWQPVFPPFDHVRQEGDFARAYSN